jgi:hypothetical protein
MAADGTRTEVARAGRVALADELYDLRCELALAELGERSYTGEQHERMRRRAAELEPLIGGALDALLAAEDQPAAG